jgi:hypothetical protein
MVIMPSKTRSQNSLVLKHKNNFSVKMSKNDAKYCHRKIQSCDEDCASETHPIERKIFLEAELTALYNISKNQPIPRYHSIVGV